MATGETNGATGGTTGGRTPPGLAGQPRPAYGNGERRLLELLSDGMPHSSAELARSMSTDPEPVKTNYIMQLVFHIRRKMAGRGELIVTEMRGGRLYYRHVRLLRSPYEP